ncbi:MAG: cysteine synthase, partial [Halobacteriales archaeon]
THEPETNVLFDPELVDDVVQVSDRAAHDELKRLAREEGHLVASSAGAASVAARRTAEAVADGALDVPHDSVVTVFPDSSERYLSKGIYRAFDAWAG